MAEQLHLTHAAVLDMSGLEFVRWVQYFALKAEREKLSATMARGGDL